LSEKFFDRGGHGSGESPVTSRESTNRQSPLSELEVEVASQDARSASSRLLTRAWLTGDW
jgi:hypothetical protein